MYLLFKGCRIKMKQGTLLCGKHLNLMNLTGSHLGEKEDLGGTLNALQLLGI